MALQHYGTTASKKNQIKTAKSEKSAKSAVLPTSLMSFFLTSSAGEFWLYLFDRWDGNDVSL